MKHYKAKVASNIYLACKFPFKCITNNFPTKNIFIKCLDGFDLLRGTLLPLHLVSTFLIVSPTYDSPQLCIAS